MSEKNATMTHLKQRRAKIEADAAEIERQVYDLETSLLTLNVRSSVLNGFTLFCACCLLCASASSNPLRTFPPEL